MPRLEVVLAERSYGIEIGAGSWAERIARTPNLKSPLAVVVTNPTVHALHGAALEAALWPAFKRVEVREVPDGESSKHWPCVSWLCEELASMGAGRDVLLVALGGGVIGDLTGFVASIYMRGVRFLQVPTTLLAQVDSSVGGKTGINLPQGKNLVGAFHQPAAVWADSTVLGTLPAREYAAGLAEVIKYGPIADLAFFEWLEANMPRLVARDPQAIGVAVRRSCEIKAAIVAMDEREDGIRAVLNFGHTFGHGLERGLGYGALLHGEAVGIGMLMATRLSVAHLGLDNSYLDRLERLLAAAGLPTEVQGWSPQQLLAWMRTDKKAVAGAIRYVVIPKWGEAALASVADEAVLQVLDDTVRAMRG
ncbi:3-dehydroquinate synthase [Inhella gelatinilytica]|uniref:3-dehydroquinate synthase n=1 Tax=Inhella gelatinilytica TaxID=2795030 RepID=A0A931IWP3_9BURK|nr:3-dehydroquinate synthase [Inhella gelatinilytica]MBH9552434.1 3-dehydroquinate synthase [Inhella gelatinilytica]